MTKKDYELIARCINDAFYVYGGPTAHSPYACEGIEAVARYLAIDLKKANPRFDADKFITACTKGHDNV